MKRVFSEAKEKTTTESETLLSLSQYTGITLKDDAKKVGMFEAESTIGYNVVHPGQFVMNIMLAWNGSYAVSDYEGIISPSYCVFNFNEDCEKKYFHYLLRLPAYAGAFKTMSKGIIESRLRLYPVYFLAFKTIIPPLNEQQSIVAYIEEKTSKIDAYVVDKEKELRLLNELKETEIANVVTQGLNHNVKMKDSGIPWIGMIPEHWEMVKLKVYCKENKEKNRNNQESTVLSLSYGNVIVKQDLNAGLLPENYDSYQIVNPGYIILRLTDLQNDHKSLRTGLVKNRGIITNAYVGLIVEKINPAYTRFLLHSYDLKKLFYSMGGGLRQSMSYKDVANLMICVPPLSEQRAIVEHIENKCNKVNSLISELEAEIEYLKEYKQRLIADCVTGQINVQ
ncbi:MAG: restriction endonuclease subunit S [Bacteroidales bacterium]|nr:restriction endonuclease subunit S [Bacteroidales bacterium]